MKKKAKAVKSAKKKVKRVLKQPDELGAKYREVKNQPKAEKTSQQIDAELDQAITAFKQSQNPQTLQRLKSVHAEALEIEATFGIERADMIKIGITLGQLINSAEKLLKYIPKA